MKLLVIALAALLGPQTAAAAEPGAAVFVFDRLKADSGEVMVALYDTEAAYAARKGAREVRVKATGARAEVRFDDLKPGAYAAMIFHDVNGDGRMNFAPVGFPLEPYAFSNNAPGRFGPAAWKSAVFEVRGGETRQAIRLR